jgi:hypothetical protein
VSRFTKAKSKPLAYISKKETIARNMESRSCPSNFDIAKTVCQTVIEEGTRKKVLILE